MANKVLMGQVVAVENKDPKPSANKNYYAIQVEDETGKKEECLLFTVSEWINCSELKISLLMKPGRMYTLKDGRFEGYLIKAIEIWDGKQTEVIRKVSKQKLATARDRASKNPEDLTKKNWIADILD